jgi:hypothetical protein
MFMNRFSRLLILITGLLLVACASRYRLDLFLIDEYDRYKMEIDQTVFTPNTQLNNPFDSPSVVQGDHNTVMISTGRRGGPDERISTFGFSVDQYIVYRLYLEFPLEMQPGSVSLVDHSFVRLMKYYEIPVDEKIFLPISGQFVIDSVRSNDVFGTFQEARWENKNGITVEFAGRLRFEID